MRHRKVGRRLCRTGGQRKALLGNLAISLLDKERITTTVPRAKELRPFAERLITTAKKDTLHARRLLARVIHDKELLRKVFSQIGPRYAERPGGYTRILKLGQFRRGDNAELALIELVDSPGRSKSSSAAPSASKRKAAPREDASKE